MRIVHPPASFAVRFITSWIVTGFLLSGVSVAQQDGESKVLRFKMKKLDGEDVSLNDYRGKVVLIVNVASQCGLTPQYTQLQQLHEKYGKKGLAIVGFPCNQFGAQEPGTAEQIAEFCSSNYGVEFDMFAKVDVNGDAACDLYKTLTNMELKPAGKGKIAWNFEKFIVGRNGEAVARFAPRTKPDSEDVVQTIETELAKKAPAR